jgi:hypothetical protein
MVIVNAFIKENVNTNYGVFEQRQTMDKQTTPR